MTDSTLAARPAAPMYGMGLACLLMLILIVATTFGPNHAALDGQFMDTDNYTRVARLAQFWQEGGWFDPRLHNVNPPDGHALHWTRPLDIVLLAGAIPLSVFLGFEKALFIWSTVVGPLAFAASLFVATWMMAPLIARKWLWLAAVIFIGQAAVMMTFRLGRPDHNILLALCYMAVIGCSLRILVEKAGTRHAILAALAASLGVWTSVEFLVPLAPVFAVFGIVWLFGHAHAAKVACLMSAVMTVLLPILLMIEKGPVRYFEVTYDQVAFVHVYMFGALTIAWALLAVGGNKISANSPLKRTILAALALAVSAAILLPLAPGFFLSPLADVDPLYRTTRMDTIIEYQPLFTPDKGIFYAIGRIIFFLGVPLVGLPTAIYLLRKETGDRRSGWLLVAFGTASLMGMALMEAHWAAYPVIIAVPGATILGQYLMEKANASDRLGPIVRPFAVLGITFGPMILGMLVLGLAPPRNVVVAFRECPITQLAPVLNNPNGLGASQKRIAAFVDLGPEILYRTGHAVFAIPNHRLQPGYTQLYQLMLEPDLEAAKARLGEMRADLVLICRSEGERKVYFKEPKPDAFYERLYRNSVPDFLKPVDLPPDLTEKFRLFEVQKN